MQLVVETHQLQAALVKLGSIVSQKAAMPILSNVLLEAFNGELILTATDLTISIRCYLRAKVTQEGKTTLNARHFSQLIKELTANFTELNTDAQHITEIVSGSSKFKIHGMNPSSYPSLPDFDTTTKISLPQEMLKDAFFKTAFAISRTEDRYALTGLHLRIQEGKATFTSTDGKKLARTEVSSDISKEVSCDCIIPLKAVEEMQKNLEDSEDPAAIYITQDKIAVEAKDILLITKLLSGEYPDVSRLIPENTVSNLRLHREELASLLRQVSIFTNDKCPSVRFCFENGELNILSNSVDIGEGLVNMPVDYSGEKIDIAFNPTFVLDILRHSKVETIDLGIIDAFSPGLITEGESEKRSPTEPVFVIMPMRLNEA
ncbi:MAG: DNA polymerase III subunit beta [Chlamydiales bacterium]